MLVLERKVDEAIVTDTGIVVRVLRVDGERVKLGIEAPADVRVLREEIIPAGWAGRKGGGHGE